MKARYKVRFHLGLGENYRKWQVTDNITGVVTYYDRSLAVITMIDCKLRNRRGVATQIYKGQNKTVCAWIDCDWIQIDISSEIVNDTNKSFYKKISYNPRVKPYWCNQDGGDIDNQKFDLLMVFGSEVFSK